MTAPTEIETLRRLLDAGRHAEAERLLDEHPALGPETESDLHMLGWRLFGEKQFGPLATLCRRYLDRDPDSANALHLLGDALLHGGEPEAARSIYARLLARDPAAARTLGGAALAEHSLGADDAAIDLYNRLIAVDPKNLMAIENLRSILSRLGRLAEFDVYKDNLIDWDSALFQAERAHFLSANARIRAAAQSVLRDGFVILRGIVDQALIDDLLRMFQAYRAHIGSDTVDKTTLRLDVFLDMIQVPRLDATFVNPTLAEVLTDVFGATPSVDYGKSVLRLVKADDPDSFVPFHQDMRAFGLMGINLWVPLTAAGGDFPGLELLPGRTRRLLDAVPAAGNYSLVKINQERFHFDPALLVAPVLSPGDCILFLGDVVHRSYIPPGRTGERISLEVRLFS